MEPIRLVLVDDHRVVRRGLRSFLEAFPERLPRYVGRPASASPATGSKKKHDREQAELLAGALD